MKKNGLIKNKLFINQGSLTELIFMHQMGKDFQWGKKNMFA